MPTDFNPNTDPLADSLDQPFYRKWFINRFGNIRALWRVVAYIATVFILANALEMITDLIPLPDEGNVLINWNEFFTRGGNAAAMIFSGYIILRFLDKRPFNLLGMSLIKSWQSDFWKGLFLGIAMLSMVLIVLWAGGWMSLSLNDLTLALLGGISKAFLLFIVAALMEELLLRGYIFQAFIEGSRTWIAVLVLSSIFGIMHMGNPDATIPSGLNIALAGILFSVAYLKTRSLWFPTGLHIGWNWMQASFWGMGVSGFHVKWSVFAAVPSGPNWISGGNFGAEASIFATFIVLGAIYAIIKSEQLSIPTEISEAWSTYPSGYNRPPKNRSLSEV